MSYALEDSKILCFLHQKNLNNLYGLIWMFILLMPSVNRVGNKFISLKLLHISFFNVELYDKQNIPVWPLGCSFCYWLMQRHMTSSCTQAVLQEEGENSKLHVSHLYKTTKATFDQETGANQQDLGTKRTSSHRSRSHPTATALCRIRHRIGMCTKMPSDQRRCTANCSNDK